MRSAVLGCGSIGRRHLRILRELGIKDIAAFDIAPAALHAAQESDPGLSAFSDLASVWSWSPDVVLITSPTDKHAAMLAEAIDQEVHVFVEKPVSHELAGLDKLAEAAETRGLVTMVGCNMRYHPGPRTVRDRMVAGAVGDVLAARFKSGSYLPRWRPNTDHTRSYSASPHHGGAILDCIHEIDLARWMLGPATVHSARWRTAASIGVPAVGLAEILLEHASGALASVHLNYVQRDYRRCIEIVGTTGTLAWDHATGAVTRFDEKGEVAETIAQPPGWSLDDMYRDELRDLLGAVAARRPAPNALSEAIATLSLALDAQAKGAPA